MCLLMKLRWFIINSNSQGANFLKAKFASLKGEWIKYHKKSSIWPGIKWVKNHIDENSFHVIGNGNDVSLWHDAWCSNSSIAHMLNVDNSRFALTSKVSDIIKDGRWVLPTELCSILNRVGVNPNLLPTISENKDQRIWKLTSNGEFSVPSCMDLVRDHSPKINWCKWVWMSCIHPRLSSQVWKLLSGSCSTDDRLKKHGFSFASMCSLCRCNEETIDHILWNCSFSDEFWSWLHSMFNLSKGRFFMDIITKTQSKSQAVNQIWFVAVMSTMVEIWKARNRAIFDEVTPSLPKIKITVLNTIRSSAIRIKGNMFNSVEELCILSTLGIGSRPIMTQKIIKCRWIPPPLDFVKINCDGAARGNPGPAGAGIIVRDFKSATIVSISQGLGISSNFMAEVSAIILGIEWAAHNNKTKIIVCSDSSSAIMSFKKNSIPWSVKGRWNSIRNSFQEIRYAHVFREVNFAADALAKQGTHLSMGQTLFHNGRPSNLATENPDSTYFRIA
ncbi:Ribonuclease H domain [Macleaya cordata]|uniref:Ribonuclease H domain n=1 Tax=Macleaya cordata TaxID=56857 RepID=A0A200Q0I4_MACCD|nr:Ribonuclease H domain [Macleaya cordata]